MSVLVVGSMALDSVETPFGKRDDILGGSATYFSLSARFFARVSLVAVVGQDFPRKHIKLLENHDINIEGLKVETGKTFRWGGKYGYDLNVANTIYTHLNVFETFSPEIPSSYKDIKYVFLANIDPDLQQKVLSQMRNPKLVACDTMNYWIENKRKPLLDLIKSVDILFLNDGEARELTGELNLLKAISWIFKRGPKMVVIKKGEHGSIFATKDFTFCIPAFPIEDIYDPTGAGDTFAGGFLGCLNKYNKITEGTLRKAVAYGTIMASFAVESFGPERLLKLTNKEVESRYRDFQRLTRF
ncbi:MAG: sugar kinase [Candidatus Omnitrophica bacterium CG07_land_8_20_14_0_80_42_15]|uniref:Sugar kinase n=1 Tax=Candidatus Aquitaenariimonas noxiae TaxID=1974741 RepID=A0A2J0KU28_9BACT|nr:MAG: sugar kinase [Candidatus Omnitrophica bacterium CG07_land_8_20_14_0_80_42_15]